MAESTTWQSTNGKWDDPASWSNGVPSAGSEPTVAILDGQYSQASVRLGLTGASAARFITTPDYTGDVGGPGSPLQINLDERAILRGRGRHYLQVGAYAIQRVFLDSANLVDAGEITGDVGYVYAKRGKWTIAPTCSLYEYVIVNGPLADVTIKAASGSRAMAPVIVVENGILRNERPHGDNAYQIYVTGGTLQQTAPLVLQDVVIVGSCGTFRYAPGTAPATDPMFLMLGGLSDFSDSKLQFALGEGVIGQFAEIAGTALQSGPLPGMTTLIDLREDYP